MTNVEQLAHYALEAVSNLRRSLANYEGDFGGPENEVSEWIDDLLDVEGVIEHIASVTA